MYFVYFHMKYYNPRKLPKHLSLLPKCFYFKWKPFNLREKHFKFLRMSSCSIPNFFSVKTKLFMRALTLKRCAEVWRTGNEFSLNPGNENWKIEIGTPKFPAKIDFSLHWKSSGFQTETSDSGPDFLFSFLNGAQPAGWIL